MLAYNLAKFLCANFYFIFIYFLIYTMSYSSIFSPRTCLFTEKNKKNKKIMKPIIIMGKNDLPCTCTE